MKKAELFALGLTPEQIKAVQTIHKHNVQREREKCEIEAANVDTRTAIMGIVRLLEKPESLENIFRKVKIAYRREVVQRETRRTPDESKEAATPKESEENRNDGIYHE